MAEKSIIISAEEEAILLKPIDEYVGKIQEQIDALRVEGSDKVNSLKNQIAIAKENKNLTKEEQNKIIGECKKNLEKAKATEDANKQQIAKLIADYKEMDVQEIREETLLQEDLELDSLDTVELMMSIEQEFDATIELNGEVKTVGDVVALVREQVNHAE